MRCGCLVEWSACGSKTFVWSAFEGEMFPIFLRISFESSLLAVHCLYGNLVAQRQPKVLAGCY